MGKSNRIYKEIIDLYEIKLLSKKQSQTFRKYVREKLRHEFSKYNWSDDSDWEKLSVAERCTFKCIRLYNYCYNLSSNKNGIRNKVDKEMENSLLNAENEIENYNNKVVNIYYRCFYDNEYSDDENYKLYEEFCALLEEYDIDVPTPRYDEKWVKGPHTIIEYVRSIPQDDISSMISEAICIEDREVDAKVDHIALRALIKFIEIEFSIKVDFDGIRESLLYEYEYMNSEPGVPLEKTDSNLKMFNSIERLRKLDFVNKKQIDNLC